MFEMDTEQKEPLAAKQNNIKPSMLPAPTPKGLSKLPRPGLQAQQQKRKASSDQENAQHDNTNKRTRLESTQKFGIQQKSAAAKPPVQASAAVKKPLNRTISTAMRPSQSGIKSCGPARAKQNNFSTNRASSVKSIKTNNERECGSSSANITIGPVVSNSGNESVLGLAKPPVTKKRAAWDTKGRLLDMENLMKYQETQNSCLQSLMENHLGRIKQLEGQKEKLEVQKQDSSQEVEELQKKLKQSEDALYEQTREMKRKLDNLEFDNTSLSRQKLSLESELSAAQTEVSGLRTAVSELSSSQETIKSELSVTKITLERALSDGQLKNDEIAALKSSVCKHLSTIEELKKELREEESLRRKLHNTVQELKGNIRVFCRVRPLLEKELEVRPTGDIPHLQFLNDKSLELEKLAELSPNETLSNRTQNNKYEFQFDKVFKPNSTQVEVFEEISQLVQSSLDGYNVCIFAYGQTGSGKTFTMEGPSEVTVDTEGMIPRAVKQVFMTAESLVEKGWEYKFEASFVEIYNETIRDLLGKNSEEVKHEIRLVEANSNEIYVTNLTSKIVTHQEQVEKLLAEASHNRAVAETKCNERSSRSHSVFRLKIEGCNKHTTESSTGVLNLIDLAGSERLKDSGSQGARLKETQSINKSLANLGNVIMALANKEQHIPYRNSKLTFLLQNSLGGNSKTLMFVNVSPKEECFAETLNSLRFATKVNNCSIGTATKKVK